MSSPERKCPKCHALVDANARFCPNGCGRLPEESSQAAQLVLECSAPVATWYNIAHKMGNAVPFRFRMSAPDGLYSHVDEFVVKANETEIVRKEDFDFRNGSILARMLPDAPGAQLLSVEIVCRRTDGGKDVYVSGEREFWADSVLDNGTVSVNFGNVDITSDRAGDSMLNVSPVIKNVQFDCNAPRYARCREYCAFGVTLSRSEPPPKPEVDRQESRPGPSEPFVTLRDADNVIQLTSQATLSFGKMREKNDFAIRVFTASGEYDNNRSAYVSRRHFRILRYDRGCFLEDVGSTFGTTLDGSQIKNRSTMLAQGEMHIVRLSGMGVPNGAISFAIRVFPDEGGAPSGMIIDRSDGVRQKVVAVWSEAGAAVGEEGWTFRLCDGRFEVHGPDGAVQYVVPGQSVRIGARKYLVEKFNQPFSHSRQRQTQNR